MIFLWKHWEKGIKVEKLNFWCLKCKFLFRLEGCWVNHAGIGVCVGECKVTLRGLSHDV